METAATPRVTATYLASYIGKNVIVVGKVIQLRGDEATLDADGTINAQLNRDAHLSAGNGVQVIGKVNPDMSIKVLTSLDLGPGVGKSASHASCLSLASTVQILLVHPGDQSAHLTYLLPV
jgi:replication factor A3